MIRQSGSKIQRTNREVKAFYYMCKKCGKSISSEEYYTYGVCYMCRW